MIQKKKTIGILGGGQLGMMLAEAGKDLGFQTNIYCPDHESPAFKFATNQTIAEYGDKQNLVKFIRSVDYITIEFENIPQNTINFIAKSGKLFPSSDAIKISKDRLMEKDFCVENQIATNKYTNVVNISDLSNWNYDKKSVIKTRQLGYDGKGQRVINTSSEAEEAFKKFGERPCILEDFVDFAIEVSTISARDIHGNTFTYPPSENIHKNHILNTSCVPASIDQKTENTLIEISTKMITNLNYIGILAIEFFVLKDNSILVNEIAPRVHNSGHWTQTGCIINQFEQHIRAITGRPIGDSKRHSNVLMKNVLGNQIFDINYESGKSINIYGKDKVKNNRKMGHVNIIK